MFRSMFFPHCSEYHIFSPNVIFLLNMFLSMFDQHCAPNIIFLNKYHISAQCALNVFSQHCSQRSARIAQKLEMSSRGKLFFTRQSFIPIIKFLIAFFRFLSPKCWVKIEIPTLVLQNWGAGKVLCWSEYVRDKQQKLSQGEKKNKAKKASEMHVAPRIFSITF